MTTRLPLPPLPNPAALTRAANPVLAATATGLLGRRPTTARMYEDSPYIAFDPEPDEKDDGPWCGARP